MLGQTRLLALFLQIERIPTMNLDLVSMQINERGKKICGGEYLLPTYLMQRV